jgi:hypothetical protein
MSNLDQLKICNQISIPDSRIKTHNLIAQKEVSTAQELSTAHKTLGCFESIDGNEKEHLKHLKQKSDKFGIKVKSTKITREQGLISFKTIYIPSIKYSLAVCNLSIQDIDKIKKYSVDKFMPAIGYERTLPRSVVFGPQDFGGIELPHLYTEMTSNKLETMIAHI